MADHEQTKRSGEGTEAGGEAVRLEAARFRLENADAIWRAGQAERLPEGLRLCDEGLALLAALDSAEEANVADEAAERGVADTAETLAQGRLEVALWLKRGHLSESLAVSEGKGERVVDALRAYDRALDRLRKIPEERGGEVEAGAWMNRGNALQRLGGPAAEEEATRCYARTLAILAELRTTEPEALTRLALMRGAAWLNLGAARRGLADAEAESNGTGKPTPERLAAACEAFERAIAELEPWAERHPAARRNLAAAWTNLGLARQPVDAAGAVAAHSEALRVLGAQGRERAALLLNLAQARVATGDEERARDELREALRLVASHEATDPGAADTGLRARHALCVGLGREAAGDPVAAGEAAGWVESGLDLARGWAGRAPWLRATESRLFEYGAWLHRSRGGTCLAEWLMAHLHDAEPERVRLARAALAAARQDILQRGFETLVGPEAGGIVADLAALRAADERLRDVIAANQRGRGRD